MASEIFFVTGTDTGVGKTLCSAAMLHALARRHARVVGMKPVAAGLIEHEGRLVSEDVLALRAASTLAVAPELDNPVSLPEPLSPHLAARRAGVTVRVADLLAPAKALAEMSDALVVEGAGGWRVPLNDEGETLADFARALGAPVVLVVGLRLGCLNHAMLTAEAIRADGLQIAGWIANRVDPQMACADENLATLRQCLGAPLLGDVPWSPSPDPRNIELNFPALA
ncbi:dethiobiotin synthase [Ideonella sp. YS5]|uniref:dethiobiotin synthase n=1 Tax=Ideonella sp. YS5 TaxID=3453714 RepID=UPI003EEF8C5E